MNRKTLLQFAILGKQFACFISLQIMASVVIHFIRLVAPFTSSENKWTTKGRLSTKNDSAEIIV